MNNKFLRGKYTYLRVPDVEQDVLKGNWHNWFNNEKITKYLYHGVYPNTRIKQAEFVESALKRKDMVLLAIVDSKSNAMCGVISLNRIDLLNRRSEIAIVMGDVKYSPGVPLEAMALMTQYGFDKLNLNKIYAGQHVGLWKWINTLELIGYKLEGYSSGSHIRYGKIADSVYTGISSLDFYALLKQRNGKYCTEDVRSLLPQRRKINMIDQLKKAVDGIYL